MLDRHVLFQAKLQFLDNSGWIYFGYTLSCGDSVHKHVTLYSLLVLVGCAFQLDTTYQLLNSKWIFVRRLKTALSLGLRVRERERGLCSPGDYLNPRQFVGESGVNPTLEGG